MASPNFLSLVPAGSLHRVHGERTVALPGATVDILTARKIELQCWELNRLSDPYWRLYWPLDEGGVVEIEGRHTAMVPGSLYLIPPHTSFSTLTLNPFRKWYVHFNLGAAGDRSPADRALRLAVGAAARAYRAADRASVGGSSPVNAHGAL